MSDRWWEWQNLDNLPPGWAVSYTRFYPLERAARSSPWWLCQLWYGADMPVCAAGPTRAAATDAALKLLDEVFGRAETFGGGLGPPREEGGVDATPL
jgi:hypothetical protein